MSSTDLSKYRLWLYKVANEMSNSNREAANDLAQEGWIAMWKASKTFDPAKGQEASWLTRAAKMRMHDVLYRQTYLGMPSSRGHVRSGREPVISDQHPAWDRMYAYDTHVEQAPLAYHLDEIHEAIRGLPEKQRNYIFNRFWKGEFGHTWYWYQAQPVLKEKLAHLEDYVE